MSLTFGSLFSGIGGLDLGLEWAGWEVRWQVEIDPYCRRVLAQHWPAVPRYGDIRQFTGADVAEPVRGRCDGKPWDEGAPSTGRGGEDFQAERTRAARFGQPRALYWCSRPLGHEGPCRLRGAFVKGELMTAEDRARGG